MKNKNITLPEERVDNYFKIISRKELKNKENINKTFTHVKNFNDIIVIIKTNNKIKFPSRYTKEIKEIKECLSNIKFNDFKLFGYFKEEIFYVILMKIDNNSIDVRPTKEFLEKLNLEKIKPCEFKEEFGYNNVCMPYWFFNDKDEEDLYLIKRS